MQYAQGSLVTTLHAVQGFLAKNAEQLGDIATGVASKKLDDITASLDAHGREQADRALVARMATVKRVDARRALIAEHMRPIANVAKVELGNYGELTALHMPRLNITDQALIQKARAMASAALAHEPAFSQGRASANYAAELESAADNLVAVLNERSGAVASRQKATAGLEADSNTARKQLRVINDLVRGVIKKDPALVAQWNAARRVAMKAGSPRLVVTAEDVAPASAITPPTPAITKEAA